MNWITILNYNTGEIYCDELDENDEKLLQSNSVCDFFSKYGMNEDECSWMFTELKPIMKSFKD